MIRATRGRAHLRDAPRGGITDANETFTAFHQRAWDDLNLGLLEAWWRIPCRSCPFRDVAQNVERSFWFRHNDARQEENAL